MAGPVYRAARRAYRFADARLDQWLGPQRAAVARTAMAWTAHLFFPERIGEPDPQFRLWVRRQRPDIRPIPDWAIEQMRAQSEYEPLLFPSRHRMDGYYAERLPYEFEGPGKAFARLRAAAGDERVEHVIAVPWLKVGGADHAALLHAEAMKAAGKRVLVLATEDGDSPWAARLPAGVCFIPAGAELAAIDPESRRHVIARLLLQWQPEVLHIIHSPTAWETVRAFGRAIANHTRIFASAFCDDITSEGERTSAARMHARDCAPVLSGVIADCKYYAAILTDETGITAERVHVLYLPVERPQQAIWQRPTGPSTVLWAGRLDRQKRPDILAAIAKRLPDVTFEVYGKQVFDTEKDSASELRSMANVRLRGPYDGFDSLPWRHCHLFLYTSQWDGLPNVLLEASVRGMPIVAPSVGGIPELDAENLRLVKNFSDVDAYVAAVEAAIRAASVRSGALGTAPPLTAHTWKAFSAAVDQLLLRSAPIRTS